METEEKRAEEANASEAANGARTHHHEEEEELAVHHPLTFRTWELLLVMEISHSVEAALAESTTLVQQDQGQVDDAIETTTTTTPDLASVLKCRIQSFLPRFPDGIRLQPNQTKVFRADWIDQQPRDALNDGTPISMISIHTWPAIHGQGLGEHKEGDFIWVTYPHKFIHNHLEGGIAEVILCNNPDLDSPCQRCGQIHCSPVDCLDAGQVHVEVRTRQLIPYRMFYQYFTLPHHEKTCELPPLRAIRIEMFGREGFIGVEWRTSRHLHLDALQRAGIQGLTCDELQEYQEFCDVHCKEHFVKQISGSWAHIRTDKDEETAPGSCLYQSFKWHGIRLLTAQDMDEMWTVFENLGCHAVPPSELRRWNRHIRKRLEDDLDLDDY